MKKEIIRGCIAYGAILIAAAAISVLFASCNKQIVDTTYSFDTAILYVGGEWITVDVDSWTDYEDGDQIQVKAEDGTTYLVHSNNITLIHSSKDK